MGKLSTILKVSTHTEGKFIPFSLEQWPISGVHTTGIKNSENLSLILKLFISKWGRILPEIDWESIQGCMPAKISLPLTKLLLIGVLFLLMN